jgi:predicted site-specific integrase-resolvase
MLVGYARVSTTDQTLALQQDALQQAGCTKIFTDTASGAQTERKGLTEALEYVRAGDQGLRMKSYPGFAVTAQVPLDGAQVPPLRGGL